MKTATRAGVDRLEAIVAANPNVFDFLARETVDALIAGARAGLGLRVDLPPGLTVAASFDGGAFERARLAEDAVLSSIAYDDGVTHFQDAGREGSFSLCGVRRPADAFRGLRVQVDCSQCLAAWDANEAAVVVLRCTKRGCVRPRGEQSAFCAWHEGSE